MCQNQFNRFSEDLKIQNRNVSLHTVSNIQRKRELYLESEIFGISQASFTIKFLKQQQEQYKQPLESRESSATANNDELIEYRQYLESAKTQEEQANHKREWFVKKSDEIFSTEFKGFKFNVGDNDVVYTPGSASELKKAQETPLNFVNKFLDSNGYLKDAEGYHRSLAIAMNPEKFAQFFYEQGKSQATDDVIRKTKNINMSERTAPEVSAKSGLQVKAVSQPSSKGLRIKSIKKT